MGMGRVFEMFPKIEGGVRFSRFFFFFFLRVYLFFVTYYFNNFFLIWCGTQKHKYHATCHLKTSCTNPCIRVM
jgi:hypothetical protein